MKLKNKKLIRGIACLIVLSGILAASSIVKADNFSWTGSKSQSWSDPANWSSNNAATLSIPGSNDDVYIPKTTNNPILDQDSLACNNLYLDQNADFIGDTGYNFTIYGNLLIDGKFKSNGSNIVVIGSITNETSGGVFDATGSGSVVVGGNITVGHLTPAQATFTFNGTKTQNIQVTATFDSLINKNTSSGGLSFFYDVYVTVMVQTYGTVNMNGHHLRYPAASALVYNDTIPQTTTDEWPTSIDSLIINNPKGLTITGTITIGNGINIYAGNINVKNYQIKWTSSPSLSYNGTTQITTGDELGSSIDNLTISDTAGVILGGSSDLTINSKLSLVGGSLSLGNQKLIMGPGATIDKYSSTSFIKITGNGVLEMPIKSPGILLPVGDDYNPITIVPTADGIFDIGVADGITDQDGNPVTEDAVNVTWMVTLVSSDQSVKVVPQWNDSEELSSFDRTNCYVVYRTSEVIGDPASAWVVDGSPAVAHGSDPYYQPSWGISMTEGTTYYIGMGDANSTALPVSLLNFTAAYQSGNVMLNWQTASEINNNYFEVERSLNAVNWEDIAHVNGNGTSAIEHSYSTVDNLAGVVPSGIIYYRLKQVDYNGKFTYSDIRVVNLENSIYNISVFPNPATNIVTAAWTNNNDQQATIKIINTLGTEIYNETVTGTGKMNKQIDMSAFPSEIYTLEIVSGNNTITRMITKK